MRISSWPDRKTRPPRFETYRTALASARAFERTHPGNQQASTFVAQAAIKVGGLAPEEALDLFTEARSRLEPLAETAPGDYFAALIGLGRAQLKNRDVLGSLACFSRALQVAEAHASAENARRDLAASNYWVGTVLAYNGETEAGAAKLRKAFELYRDLAGASDKQGSRGLSGGLSQSAGGSGRAGSARSAPDYRDAVERILPRLTVSRRFIEPQRTRSFRRSRVSGCPGR